MAEFKNITDILNNIYSGSTLSGYNSATDILNTVTNEAGDALRISVSGSTGGSSDWGDIGGTLSNQSDLQDELDGKVDTSTYNTFTGATNTSLDGKVNADLTGSWNTTTISNVGNSSEILTSSDSTDDYSKIETKYNNVSFTAGDGVDTGWFSLSKSAALTNVPIKYYNNITSTYDDQTLVNKSYVDRYNNVPLSSDYTITDEDCGKMFLPYTDVVITLPITLEEGFMFTIYNWSAPSESTITFSSLTDIIGNSITLNTNESAVVFYASGYWQVSASKIPSGGSSTALIKQITGTTYEVVEEDNGYILECTTGCTVTYDSNISTNIQVTIVNVSDSSDIQLNGFKTKYNYVYLTSKYCAVTCYYDGSTDFVAIGDLTAT